MNTNNPANAPANSPANTGASPGAVLEPTLTERFRNSKALVPTMAVMGVTVMALAAALVVNKSDAQPGGATDMAGSYQSAPRQEAPSPHRAPAAAIQHAPVVVAQAAPKPHSPRAVACATCGTVESTVAVQRQGQVNGVAVGNTTIGIGTVAGGLIGGVLGNQVGGGNGKTAMTVLGAAGGAYAGNAVEKNMKKVTVYQMRVRMNDGSVRTIEQPGAVAVGSRVVVEGNSMRVAAGGHS
ncbi:glycine zipper 2TM domain-containing protein [Polaromonas sp.]|uniref:glycine zipper 2TM domain-containing protein n=1 Tax=Polaromonas sp. TaxID=1869339 RepID=UPI002C793398|nr:glycine zipper 2TM domain-containing protein [Polaromonas sp.]HQS30944.1 glycine zipper 2TM domain-containing protein [Polaromonas sp.]HQS90176.1 glycine zipper 2TM domain-containing protein [Polaromonas sp.]